MIAWLRFEALICFLVSNGFLDALLDGQASPCFFAEGSGFLSLLEPRDLAEKDYWEALNVPFFLFAKACWKVFISFWVGLPVGLSLSYLRCSSTFGWSLLSYSSVILIKNPSNEHILEFPCSSEAATLADTPSVALWIFPLSWLPSKLS